MIQIVAPHKTAPANGANGPKAVFKSGGCASRKTRTTATSFTISLPDGGEHEMPLVIGYEFHPGYPTTWDEPGVEDSVEIVSVMVSVAGNLIDAPVWLSAIVESDDDLLVSIAAAAREDDVAARDDAVVRRAEDARERDYDR